MKQFDPSEKVEFHKLNIKEISLEDIKTIEDMEVPYNHIFEKNNTKIIDVNSKFKIDFYDDRLLNEIYHKTNEGNIKCELKDMNDIKKCIPYKSEIKIIFKINKIWFMSKNYGVQLKLVKVLVNIKNKEVENLDVSD